ncbi:MAG: DUF421 domain-containing protein [Syntrophomonadaceae bacterium]|nr:DUF421 domain-containing protein [Syntrophomonadaceae bacterium]
MFDFVLRAVGMYFLALVMIRLLGKRALGELGPFDFVVMTGVGHTVVSVALDKSVPFYEGIIILATLALLEYLMGYAAMKSQTISALIIGKPVVLIENGRVIKKNMAKEKFNVDDLLQELRKQGVRDLGEVEKGILESDGGFSVILKEGEEPVTRNNLGIKEKNYNEIVTWEDWKRDEFFKRQKEVTGEEELVVSLSQKLKEIEERLDKIYDKIKGL